MATQNPFENTTGLAEVWELGYVAGFAEPEINHFLPLSEDSVESYQLGVQIGRNDRRLQPPALGTRLAERFTVLAQQGIDPDALTERELEVLGYMAKGLPYKLIAKRLNVTTYTVQYHVTNILQKLQAGNRGEAVAVAMQRGLLSQVK